MSTVDLTTEVRWFFDGPLPSTVRSWFTRAGVAGLSEDRWDSYRVDGDVEVGVKRRFGATVELKRRDGRPERFVADGGLDGLLETWQRWSPAGDRVVLSGTETWLDVYKTVLKRRFDVAGHEISLSEENRAMSGDACDAEVVALSVHGRPMWSFAFAAFGAGVDHRRLVHAAWDALRVAGETPPELLFDLAGSCGYPEWLTWSTVNVGSSGGRDLGGFGDAFGAEFGRDLISQPVLLDLGAGHWPLVDEADVAGHLERGDHPSTVVDELLF